MTTTANYILDLGVLIAEKASEAKKLRDEAMNTDGYDFQQGYLMALHEVVSLMQQQADVFGIRRADIGLDNLEPERDLM